ncbi:hypothetical protein QYE76_009930 [Lolium multiflorum]|uniref:Uncharacterized protein n=1 Tax=Lolium multiflorum TaxID=4521 RepID=A0AAD8TVY8_LOLMU|nr:hypothetical protein QYE76_009930 [Lolium multiflorum]
MQSSRGSRKYSRLTAPSTTSMAYTDMQLSRGSLEIQSFDGAIDHHVTVTGSEINQMEGDYPKFYQLGKGGDLTFERDLDMVTAELERPHPEFHGVRIPNQPGGEPQWMITADLRGKMEPPTSERILFSFKASNWMDGLARALQEGLARVCGQNIAALQGTRFTHFARHDTIGEPMALSSHPVLKHHVEHLDFMLHETRKDLDQARVHTNRTRHRQGPSRSAESDEEDGEDIQGGEDFLSDDNDFEEDELTEEEDYEFLESGEDGIIPIDVDEDDEELLHLVTCVVLSGEEAAEEADHVDELPVTIVWNKVDISDRKDLVIAPMSDIQMATMFGIPVDEKDKEKEKDEAADDGNRQSRTAAFDADIDSELMHDAAVEVGDGHADELICVYDKENPVIEARKNPLWTYAGGNDANRLSSDLSAKDLEKLIRRISRLNKKDPVPSSCRVEPYSSTNPLPENHPTMASLPPLLRMEKSKNKLLLPKTIKVLLFMKVKSQVLTNLRLPMKRKLNLKPASRRNPFLLLFPQRTKGKGMTETSGTSKPEEAVPSHPKSAYDPYSELSSVLMKKKRYQPLMWLLERPLIKDLLRIGTQFVGYREYASKAEEKLAETNERANTLAQQLEQSEKARKKAESDAVGARAEADKAKADAAGVEDLRKRLHDAETSLSEHITAQSAREEAILKRLRTQSRRFVEELKELRVQLQSVKKQSLILMEQSRESSQREKIALQQAQDAMTEKDAAVAEAAAATSRENSMLQLLIDASLDMAGAFLDTANENERVEACSNVLLRLAREHGSTFWGTPDRTCQIVRFQDRALQDFVSSFIECVDIIF